MKNLLLSLNNVSMCYKHDDFTVQALDNINLELYRGEILGIIGESGSGKSTIAKLITCMEKATAGELFFAEKNITNLSQREQRNLYRDIQMVFQDAVGSFNSRRTIGESIAEAISNLCDDDHDCIAGHVLNLLLEVGLKAEYAQKYPHELSGGECQRAAIARALAVKPSVLICDEATSALDVSVQARIIKLLLQLRDKYNISIIFISHDLPLVSSITDRIIIMHNGKIVEAGKTSDIINNPQTLYTQTLLEAVLS